MLLSLCIYSFKIQIKIIIETKMRIKIKVQKHLVKKVLFQMSRKAKKVFKKIIIYFFAGFVLREPCRSYSSLVL